MASWSTRPLIQAAKNRWQGYQRDRSIAYPGTRNYRRSTAHCMCARTTGRTPVGIRPRRGKGGTNHRTSEMARQAFSELSRSIQRMSARTSILVCCLSHKGTGLKQIRAIRAHFDMNRLCFRHSLGGETHQPHAAIISLLQAGTRKQLYPVHTLQIKT